ncbi:MAG: large conductance mechanosensitive channel protein MscL [Clostridia bacterium]|nr:large conductance mechanosensitive channel protein MscL [Clostridia bacterium]
MKKFFGEFKEFITKGNVMDMAVGSIIGLSFKDLVTSFTNDIISPILGVFGGVDFSDMKWVIGTKEVIDEATGVTTITENTLNYGAFITGVINFIIMALVIFSMVKLVAAVSGWSKKLIKKGDVEVPVEEAPAPETSEDILKDIRELLKAQSEKEAETANK